MRLDLDKIEKRIQFIRRNLADLRELASLSESEFLSDKRNFHTAIRLLQISIEAMLDIFSHIVARLHLGAPSDDRETLEAVRDKWLVTQEHHQRYFLMNKFRNKVVHGYLDVDAKQVYGMLQEDLGDFDKFFDDVGRIVESERAKERSNKRRNAKGKK